MFSGATVMLTWRLMPWKACESWMWVDMILLWVGFGLVWFDAAAAAAAAGPGGMDRYGE